MNQLAQLSIALEQGQTLPPQFQVPPNEDSLFESMINAGEMAINRVFPGAGGEVDIDMAASNIQQDADMVPITDEWFRANPNATQVIVRDLSGNVFVRRRP